MNDYLPVSPRAVFEQISRALPAKVREHVIGVGSLAAGYRMVLGQPRQEEFAGYLASGLSPTLLEEVRRTGLIRLAPATGGGHA